METVTRELKQTSYSSLSLRQTILLGEEGEGREWWGNWAGIVTLILDY